LKCCSYNFPQAMNEFSTQNSLRLFVGSLFVLSIVIAVLLFKYANQSVTVSNLQGVVASDTIAGDITIRSVDSLQFIR
jgi:hypothetical protein